MKKKLLVLLMSMVMCISMNACSTKEDAGADTAESEAIEESEQEQEYEDLVLNTAINKFWLASSYKKNTTASFEGWAFLPEGLVKGAKNKDGIVIVLKYSSENPYLFSEVYDLTASQNGIELKQYDSCEAGIVKAVDDYSTPISNKDGVQIAEVYDLIDESPVTVQLVEKGVTSNVTQITIDLNRSSDETKKNVEKYSTADIENIVTSYSIWEMSKPVEDVGSMSFSFSADGTGYWNVDTSQIPISWIVGKNDKENAEALYGLLIFLPESKDSQVADYLLNFGEDSQSPYLFFDYENLVRPK